MTNETAKTMYLSKYALTAGIREEKVEKINANGFAWPLGGWQGYKVGRDLHETMDGAVAAAEAARLKKIKSLKEQLKKLEALSFAEKKGGVA